MLTPVRPPKRPIKKHRPKVAETSRNGHFSSVFAQDKQPALPVANNSAKFDTNAHKPQQNPVKNHKNEGFYSPQTGQSQGHLAAVALHLAGCGHSAVRSHEQKADPPISERPKQPEWPLAASLLRALFRTNVIRRNQGPTSWGVPRVLVLVLTSVGGYMDEIANLASSGWLKPDPNKVDFFRE